jgi:hypothetical protein
MKSDDCGSMSQNQGNYVPRWPDEFLKSMPLGGATGVRYFPRLHSDPAIDRRPSCFLLPDPGKLDLL